MLKNRSCGEMVRSVKSHHEEEEEDEDEEFVSRTTDAASHIGSPWPALSLSYVYWD